MINQCWKNVRRAWNVSRILNDTFLRKFKRPILCFENEVFSMLFFFFISSLFIIFHSHFQAFIQALLAVIVFRIKIEFSGKCQQISDKRPCGWVSGGCCEPPWRGSGRNLINFPISCILSHHRCDLSGLRGQF